MASPLVQLGHLEGLRGGPTAESARWDCPPGVRGTQPQLAPERPAAPLGTCAAAPHSRVRRSPQPAPGTGPSATAASGPKEFSSGSCWKRLRPPGARPRTLPKVGACRARSKGPSGPDPARRPPRAELPRRATADRSSLTAASGPDLPCLAAIARRPRCKPSPAPRSPSPVICSAARGEPASYAASG